MDRARILAKIQKCFALSKSSNAGEAANALRQAQKMIEMHDVGDAELGAVGYGDEKVSVPIQANVAVPASLGALITLIKRAFGVNAVVEREMRVSDYSFGISAQTTASCLPVTHTRSFSEL